MMDECRNRLRKVGRKGVEGSSSDFYFASLDGNLVLDAGERPSLGAAMYAPPFLAFCTPQRCVAGLVASVCTLNLLVL